MSRATRFEDLRDFLLQVTKAPRAWPFASWSLRFALNPTRSSARVRAGIEAFLTRLNHRGVAA